MNFPESNPNPTDLPLEALRKDISKTPKAKKLNS